VLAQVDVANLNAHILEYPAVHFGAVNKRLEDLERGVANRQTAPRADENITSKLQDFDVRLKTLESQPQKLQSRMVLDSNTGAAGAAAAVATSGAAAAGATAMFGEAADVSEQLLVYEGVISVLAREMDRTQTQVSRCHVSFSHFIYLFIIDIVHGVHSANNRNKGIDEQN
jgi:high-affinity Fe2+/Pb2+ permease